MTVRKLEKEKASIRTSDDQRCHSDVARHSWDRYGTPQFAAIQRQVNLKVALDVNVSLRPEVKRAHSNSSIEVRQSSAEPEARRLVQWRLVVTDENIYFRWRIPAVRYTAQRARYVLSANEFVREMSLLYNHIVDWGLTTVKQCN